MEQEYQNLARYCRELGVTLSEVQIGQFKEYYELITEWNSFMNLTAITELSEVVQKHFTDSLALIKAGDLSGTKRIMDVGTGAGFPGLPLKIAFPELEVVLLDSLNKRVKFLNEVIAKLGLKGITAIHGRAEDYAKQGEYREQFDFVVSRAVANLASLSEYCLPYVKAGGFFVPYKSGSIDEELAEAEKAVSVLGGKIKQVQRFTLPESDIERTLVVVEKVKATPKKYPRKAGLPAKEPIH